MIRAAACFGLGCVFLVLQAEEQEPADQATDEQVERGRYLVHNVAKCIECHTPRLADGQLNRHRLLAGAPIPFTSPYPQQRWAFRSPPLAGLPGWDEAEMLSILQTGRRTSGIAPLPPMPRYALSEEDARAVVAYLRSL